jgi:hypothetical protein
MAKTSDQVAGIVAAATGMTTVLWTCAGSGEGSGVVVACELQAAKAAVAATRATSRRRILRL